MHEGTERLWRKGKSAITIWVWREELPEGASNKEVVSFSKPGKMSPSRLPCLFHGKGETRLKEYGIRKISDIKLILLIE